MKKIERLFTITYLLSVFTFISCSSGGSSTGSSEVDPPEEVHSPIVLGEISVSPDGVGEGTYNSNSKIPFAINNSMDDKGNSSISNGDKLTLSFKNGDAIFQCINNSWTILAESGIKEWEDVNPELNGDYAYCASLIKSSPLINGSSLSSNQLDDNLMLGSKMNYLSTKKKVLNITLKHSQGALLAVKLDGNRYKDYRNIVVSISSESGLGKDVTKSIVMTSKQNGKIHYAIVNVASLKTIKFIVSSYSDDGKLIETNSCTKSGVNLNLAQTSEVTLTLNADKMVAGEVSIGQWGVNDSDFSNVDATASKEQTIQINSLNDFLDVVTKANSSNDDANYAGKIIKLNTDIDMSSVKGFQPMNTGLNPFLGTFDGNGHTISNLTIVNYKYSQALFSEIGYGAEVKNLTLNNFNVGDKFSSTFIYYGALAGINRGILTNCKVKNSYIVAGDYVGGIVGENRGKISGCSCDNTIVTTLDADATFKGNIYGVNNGGIIK